MRTLLVTFALAAAVAAASSPAHAQPAASYQAPSRTLERAIKLYDKVDFFSASVELAKVMAGESGDSPPNVRRAEWFQAKVMVRLELHAAAASLFARIIERDPPHEYRLAAIKWLVAEAEQSTYAGDLLGAYKPEDGRDPSLDDETRAAFYFYLGRAAARRNDATADTILSEVRPGSRLWGRAQLERAGISFRTQQLDAGIQLALQAATDPAVAVDAVRAIGFWSRALGAPAAATKALTTLSSGETTSAGVASLERSRTALEAAGGMATLAKVDAAVFADTIAAAVCSDGQTADAAPALLALARDGHELIAKLGQIEPHDEFAAAVLQRTEHPQTRVDVWLRASLADPETDAMLRWHASLVAEMTRLGASDKAWQTTQIAAEAMQEVAIQQALALGDIGKRFADRLVALDGQLGELEAALAAIRTKISAGPDVAIGAGIVLAPALCRAVLGTSAAIAPTAIATTTAPTTTTTHGRGCAGCAASTDAPASALALIGLAIVLRRRRRVR